MSKIKEINELKRLEESYIALKEKIEKFSTYDPNLLATFISKVMTAYENKEFEVKKEENVFIGNRIFVAASEEPEKSISFKLFSYDFEEKEFYDTFDDNRNLSVMFPSGYLKESEDDNNYLEEYFNYLFKERIKDNKEEIDEEYLEKVTNDFIENTKDEQKCYQNSKKEDSTDVIEEYMNNCEVERTSFFKAIGYIINNYTDIKAIEKIDEEKNSFEKFNSLKVTHSIILSSDKYEFANKTIEYNKTISYPKNFNEKLVDYANYNSIIECLGDDLINNCIILDDFLSNIYDMFLETQKVEKEDVVELLECYKIDRVKTKLLSVKNNE